MNVSTIKKILLSPIVFNDILIEIVDVIDANHPVGQYAGPHKHPWYEFNFVTDGYMNVTIDSVDFTVTENNFCLVPANTLHSNHWPDGDDGLCVRFSLHRNGEYDSPGCYDELLSILSKPYPEEREIDISPLTEDSSPYALQSAFVSLLFKICELFAP